MEKTNKLCDSVKGMEEVVKKLILNYHQTIKTVEERNAQLKASPEEYSVSNKVVSEWLDGWLFDMNKLCEVLEEDLEYDKLCLELLNRNKD